ncbi:MAG: energy transducer TonB, partial [Cyanobacteriota/Melainabacteria group bacterium]
YFYDNSESGKKSVAKLRSLLRASIPSPDKNLARGNVAVTVNPNGTVRDVTIQTTTGNADIDKKVLDIIKKTRMSPFKPEDGLDRKFLNLKFDDPAINAPKLKKPTKKSPQKKQQ